MKVHVKHPARVERLRSIVVEWDEGHYTFFRYFKTKGSAEGFKYRLLEKHGIKRAEVRLP